MTSAIRLVGRDDNGGLKGDFFPLAAADRAEVVAMLDAGGNAVEVERVGTLCCKEGMALARFHAA